MKPVTRYSGQRRMMVMWGWRDGEERGEEGEEGRKAVASRFGFQIDTLAAT